MVRDSRPGDDEEAEAGAVGSRPERHYYRVVLWHTEQGFCIGWRSTTDEAFADRQNTIGLAIRFDRQTGAPLQNCPPRTPAAAPEARTIAADVWEQVEDLPVPTLDVEPDHAITGKKVYLQIRGARTWSKTIDNPIGDDIVITATSDYLVDWDDPVTGEKTRTSSSGGPWPTGDVTHVYTDTSQRREIRVTQRWHATWHAGGRTGALTELTTQARPLPIRIHQIQAVRNR